MEQSFIDEMERRRYRNRVWQTVIFAVFFPFAFYVLPVIRPNIDLFILIFVCLVVMIAILLTKRIEDRIKADPELRSALNNELYIANERRAYMWGYNITISALFVMYILPNYCEIPVKMMAVILIMVGILSYRVAQLILHR